ncbi:MAG: hypothetical protein BA865_14360 [Desulfobacterales bacterium S5133MH4]|nr:MAG: hypothetical protein BA865_14360 [Desulfobacterales bacterium S5133MH4]
MVLGFLLAAISKFCLSETVYREQNQKNFQIKKLLVEGQFHVIDKYLGNMGILTIRIAKTYRDIANLRHYYMMEAMA